MVALPAATAVTFPLLLTVATLVSLEDQVTVLSVALSGFTIAASVSSCPVYNKREVLLMLMSVTSTPYSAILTGKVLGTVVPSPN